MENIINIFKLSENAIIPSKGTKSSACYDIHACFHNDTVNVHGMGEDVKVEENDKFDKPFIRLYPDDLVLIPTGLIFFIPEKYHLKFYSRSGNVWKRLLVVANQPAIIDSDYILESFVLIHNKSKDVRIIKDGDAIAQCELCKSEDVMMFNIDVDSYEYMVKSYTKKSDRIGGFGSTDAKP